MIDQGKLVFDGPTSKLGARQDMETQFHHLTGFTA
jgi:hypothetical protein